MKVIEAQQGFIILGSLDITNVSVDVKYKLMNIHRVFKKAAKEFEEFIKDTQEKVSDTKEQNEILSKEAEREIELKYDRLGKETFDKVLEVSKWNVTQATLMEDLIK